MNWSNVKLILAREIRDQLRDRRTMFMILVLPVLLYPLLGMCVTQISQFVREKPTKVLVVGADSLPEKPTLLEDGRFAERLFESADKARLLDVELATDDPQDSAKAQTEARFAVQEGTYEAAVYIPPDFSARLKSFQEAIRQHARETPPGGSTSPSLPLAVPEPKILCNTAREKSQITFARLKEVLRRWTEEVSRSNLTAAGVPQSAVTQIEPQVEDVAKDTGHQGTAVWSKILPVLLLLWALTGAFYPAIDLCAGEKERGTLETLLSSPAERSEIVLGKLVTIMLFSGVTAVLNILSMGILGFMVLSRLPGFGPPPLADCLWLLVALVPVSALFSALCLALAAFAKSTKEGQYYLMPLLLLTLPLAVLGASGMELNLGNSLIPVTGVVLILRAALEGNYWQAAQFVLPVVLVTLLGCLGAIRWAVEQFNSESVLFRESERFDIGLWLHQLREDRKDTPTIPMAVCCGLLIPMIYFFLGPALAASGAAKNLIVVAVVTQLAVIVTPALLMTIMLTRSPRETLLLKLPRWWTIPAAMLLAVLLHPAIDGLRVIVMNLYPMAEGMEKQLEGLFANEVPWWQLLLVLALLPAVCEELAFRGFILSGFRHLGSKWRAIVYSAVFFGISHVIFQQSLITCIVGMVIAFLAVQSGSLLPGMIFHMTHNALAVSSGFIRRFLLEQWPGLHRLLSPDDPTDLAFRWPVLLVGTVAAFTILMAFHRLPCRKSAEEAERELIHRLHAETI